ncbi:MAG: NAD-dependent epimerase/dehydratase family protein [Proteobacteria bacterium]|nr:NAD-dependent epimerase/dehydratase family protein [Pseudomonadota bacterium]MBU1714112.1 NAD-dependent epimerase/dehydratase family protein [Pseudomonadota bacterium]
MRKAIVTGGGGFVGLSLVRRLVAQGVEVAVVGRNHYPVLDELGVISFQGDIRDLEFLTNAFHGYDTVFHVAAKAGIWGRWSDYYSINVTGTENVIAACLENSIDTLVYTSTPSVVFSNVDLCGVNELTRYATSFLCHYAHTKVIAEKIILAANGDNLRTVALRPHLVWGPGDPNLIPRLIDRGRKGLLKKVGDGRNLVDISYVDNVAQAHVLAARNLKSSGTAAGKPYFISQGEPVNLWNWINKFFRRIDVPSVEKSISFRQAYLAGWTMEMTHKLLGRQDEPLMTRFLAEQLAKSHWFSMDNALKDFNYIPEVSTLEGMNRMVEWFKQKK